MEQLAVEQAQLLMASRADNTHSTYAVALEAFKKFCRVYDYDPQILPDTEKVAQFVAYLSWCGYAGSTVQTYLSGLAFYLQSAGAKDVTRNFVIARLVEGCRRRSSRRDTRHPITLSILSRMLPGLAHVCDNNYDVLLYKAAFLLAFHGFLRISEFAVTSQRKQERMLRMSDVKVAGHAPRRRIELFLRASKTDQRGVGCTISIPEVDSEICPVKAALRYLGNASERWRGFLLLIRHSSNH